MMGDFEIITELRKMALDDEFKDPMPRGWLSNALLACDVAERQDKQRQISAGHYADEKASHRRTREMLAAQIGVKVDTEQYDVAVDRMASHD